MEHGKSVDVSAQELHVTQQLRYSPHCCSRPRAGIRSRTWSNEWVKWRDKAGWPKKHGGFHALRHFFATTLITNHAEPQDVQRLLRHRTLRITLETYVHWWPRRERRRGFIGDVLRAAAHRR
ncbi:tyrosine-type recombinase/integrase [Micromonospora sp. NPDC049274]|uniref:tyrosine-type recombinase/integrase n=1 Tax=Micromonospora sp. NPDC049274 TaxID=3154829 RepID=UPI00342FDC54